MVVRDRDGGGMRAARRWSGSVLGGRGVLRMWEGEEGVRRRTLSKERWSSMFRAQSPRSELFLVIMMQGVMEP